MNRNETEVGVIESQSRTCSDCDGIGMIKVKIKRCGTCAGIGIYGCMMCKSGYLNHGYEDCLTCDRTGSCPKK